MTTSYRHSLLGLAAFLLTAALVSLALVYPREMVDPVLGEGWSCSRAVFVTSCSRVAPVSTRHSRARDASLHPV